MNQPDINEILLNIDLDTEEYDLDLNTDFEEYEFGLDTKIEITKTLDGALPSGGNPNDILIKQSTKNFDAQWVPPATSVEADNTRPITAAAVYTEIGNINALLATI